MEPRDSSQSIDAGAPPESASKAADVKAGTQVLGRYKLLEQVEQSQSGELWHAKDEESGTSVFVRVLDIEHTPDDAAALAMSNGIRLLSGHSLENIAKIISVGVEKGRALFAMEHPQGVMLDKILATKKRFNSDTALVLAIKIAKGLKRLLELTGSHCGELKPSRIMVSEADATPSVCEAGVGALLYGAAIKKGETLGSPNYMSPEQCAAEPIDWRGDQYALGAILCHMIAGSPPFDSDDVSLILRKQAEETVLQPIERMVRCSLLDSECASLIRRMMAKKPLDRFSSWDEFIKEAEAARTRLGGAASGVPVKVTELGVSTTPWMGVARQATAKIEEEERDDEADNGRISRSLPVKWMTIGGLAAVVVALAAIALWMRSNTAEAERLRSTRLIELAREDFAAAEAKLTANPKDFDEALSLYERAMKTPSSTDRAQYQRRYGEVLLQQKKIDQEQGPDTVKVERKAPVNNGERAKPEAVIAKEPPAPEKAMEANQAIAKPNSAVNQFESRSPNSSPSSVPSGKRIDVNEILDKAVSQVAQYEFKSALDSLKEAALSKNIDPASRKVVEEAVGILTDVCGGEASIIAALRAESGKTIPLKIGNRPLTEVRIISVKDDGSIIYTPKGEAVGGKFSLNRLHPEERVARAKFSNPAAKAVYLAVADFNAGRAKEGKEAAAKAGCLSDRLVKAFNEKGRADGSKKSVDSASQPTEPPKTPPVKTVAREPSSAAAAGSAQPGGERQADDDLEEIVTGINKLTKNLNSRMKSKRQSLVSNKEDMEKSLARVSYLASMVQDKCMKAGGRDINIKKPLQIYLENYKALAVQRSGANDASIKCIDQLSDSISSLKAELEKVKKLKTFTTPPQIVELESEEFVDGKDEDNTKASSGKKKK